MIRMILVLVCLLGFIGFADAAGHNTDAGTTPVATGESQSQSDDGGQGAEGEEGDAGLGSNMWIMLVLMVGFMYFVLIRPQGKEQKRRKSMMSEIKVGDKVVTIGGIHGVVDRKGEEDVDVKVKDGTLITFNLGAVSQVVQDGEKIKAQE